jgi:hypothetical protein
MAYVETRTRSGLREKQKSGDEEHRFRLYTFVVWKIRKHLTRVESLLSGVNDVLPFPLTVLGDCEAYPESNESDEVR